MKYLTLTLKLSGFKKPMIYINNKAVLTKKDKRSGLYTYTLMTEEDSVNIKILSVHELEGKLWFLISYIFFLISCLGIFDQRIDKKCQMVKYESNIKLNEGNNYINFVYPSLINTPTGKLIIDSNVEAETLDNEFYIDLKLKKKYKILKIFKILTWLLIIIGVPIALVLIFSI